MPKLTSGNCARRRGSAATTLFEAVTSEEVEVFCTDRNTPLIPLTEALWVRGSYPFTTVATSLIRSPEFPAVQGFTVPVPALRLPDVTLVVVLPGVMGVVAAVPPVAGGAIGRKAIEDGWEMSPRTATCAWRVGW